MRSPEERNFYLSPKTCEGSVSVPKEKCKIAVGVPFPETGKKVMIHIVVLQRTNKVLKLMFSAIVMFIRRFVSPPS